jgi:hypothetical protein
MIGEEDGTRVECVADTACKICINYTTIIYGINPEKPRQIWYKPDEIPLKDYFVQGGYLCAEPPHAWEESVFDPDYEISIEYPYPLRHKASKKILKEYFSKRLSCSEYKWED